VRDKRSVVRFAATKAGALPNDGSPTVGGVRLPAGRRRAPWATPGEFAFWCSDEGDYDAFELARELTEVFPRTGLWPCLWDFEDEPASYCDRPAALVRVDARKARAVLAAVWSRHPPRASWVEPYGTRFAGLAERGVPSAGAFDPFALYEQRQRSRSSWDDVALRPRLVLVPCRRPADVIAVIGLQCGTAYAGIEDQALVSSVLRSWEDRFEAYVVGLDPGGLTLAVGSPPTKSGQALRLAAEHFAFAPPEDAGRRGALSEMATGLVLGELADGRSSRRLWEFGWND
jgi:hypothetical protein